MPVLKTYKNGVWEPVSGMSEHTHTKNDIMDFPSSLPADGGNADTLDGKHANEFASASDVEALQDKVGDTSVSEQITSAISEIEIPDEIYVQNDEPIDAEDGSLWVDLDEEGFVGGNFGEGSAPTLNYEKTKTVYLGDDVLGAPSLGDGWTTTDGVYTHATGHDADLTFETAVEEGSVYLLEFDTSYTANEFVRVGIGDRYRILCYNGSSKIIVPLLASGGTTLYITPVSDTYVGSISNIKLRKIQESGEECILELYSTTTDNHTKNYGFWNTFIGKNTAENAVGSTRSVAIGYYTLNALQGGHRNIGIGTFAMSQLIGGEENVSIGSDNMLSVKNAVGCVSMGHGAMYNGKSRADDVAIGLSALYGTESSETSGNVAIGKQAGYKVTTAKSNIFLGKQAGYNATSAYCNTIIGDGAAKQLTTGYFNTAIGRNTVVPAAARNTVVIGDGAEATKNYQAVIGADNITETLLKGNLIVRGTDGVNRQIVFNEDGTVGWTAV